MNYFTLPFVFWFLLRGKTVYYLHLSDIFRKDIIFQIFKKIRICPLSYEMYDENSEYRFYSKITKISKIMFREYFYEHPFNESLHNYFQLNDDLKLKFDVVLEDEIVRKIVDFVELYTFAEYIGKQSDKSISLFAENNTFTQAILKDQNKVNGTIIKNACGKSLSYLFEMSAVMTIVLSKLFTKLRKKSQNSFQTKLVDSNKTNTGTYCQDTNSLSQEIIFFPHQGVFYGNLFLKDHFYHTDTASPFYHSNTLHLSLGESKDILDKSWEYYKKFNIPYADFNDLPSHGGLFSSLKSFLNLLLSSPQMRGEIFRLNFLIIWIYLRLFVSVQINLIRLSSLKKTKIALVGYDIVFSRALTFSLSVKGIKTIATQERFFATWYTYYNRYIFDHYFVNGETVSEIMKQSESCKIGEVINLGPVRLDLIHHEMNEPVDGKYSKIKKDYFLVFAFDYHSNPDEISNCQAPANNWKNNRKFYRDIIRLSHRFQDAFFVIKGKNSDFCNIPVFEDLVKIMESLPNIMIEKDIQTYTPQKVVFYADAAIAMQTSLADEMLAAGKPVLFYDYLGLPTPYFDYEGYPVIVHDFEELSHRLQDIIGGNFIDEKQFSEMRKRFYNDSFDGKIKQRLQTHMMEIYQQCSEQTS